MHGKVQKFGQKSEILNLTMVVSYMLEFRWVKVLKEPIDVDGATDSVGWLTARAIQARKIAENEISKNGAYPCLEEGVSYVLQIPHGGKWVDYLELKRSTLYHGGVGLFSKRPLPVGFTLGWYTGKTIWRSGRIGGKTPDATFLEETLPKSPFVNYQQEVRNSEGEMVVVEPQ